MLSDLEDSDTDVESSTSERRGIQNAAAQDAIAAQIAAMQQQMVKLYFKKIKEYKSERYMFTSGSW